MFRRSILSIAICIVAVHEIFGDQRQAKSSIFQINHKKPVHAVSDKFLSFTVDPTTLLHVADCQLSNATLSQIKGLLPAYLRVAGTDSNRLLFRSASDEQFPSDLSASTSSKFKNLVLSGNQWNKFYEFVSSTGLNLIVCLSGGIFNEQTERDLSNALEFITFSNKNNFNMNWQLGYELQKISRDDGKVTGQDVAKLRKILEVFPRYQDSLIIGPDVTNFESRENILFLRNYLLHAQNSLNVFTVHPNFTTIRDEDLYDALSDLFSKMDTYLWMRDGIFKTASKGVVPKKPIWIAESENKEPECKFTDSMSLIKRLGFAAKLGASVYLRKPHLLSIYEPTSEFWAAALFKALVGRSVLDTRLASGTNSSVVAFSHCTQILEKPEESIINPTVAYERGSITAYGVNDEAEPVRLIFKTGIKTDETVHMYVLTEDSRNRIGKILLNRQHLGLSDENDLPMLSPRIRESAQSVVIPAHSIFFLVFPNTRCRACMQQLLEDNQEASKNKIRPPVLDEEELTVTSETSVNIPENLEDPEDENAVYVSYPKKSERIKAAHQKLSEITEIPESMKQLRLENPAIGPKYFTFSEDTWLSSFPEKFKEIEQPSADEVPQNSQSKREKHSKIEKYRVLAQAILGQRNVTAKSLTHAEESDMSRDLEDRNRESESRTKRLMRVPRSMTSLPSEINSLYQQTRDNSHYAFVPYDPPISDDLEESNIASQWHMRSRKRRDTKGDDVLIPQNSPGDVITIFEGFPDTNNTNFVTVDKDKPVNEINPPSTLPDLVAESEGLINIRQNREIDSKSVVSHTNLAADPKIVLEESNVVTSLGAVSPFPQHEMKPTKTKSKSVKLKKMSKPSRDSNQNESNEGSSSESSLEMNFKKSIAESVDVIKESEFNNATVSSEILAKSKTAPILSSDLSNPQHTEKLDNSAKNVPSSAPTARSADNPLEYGIHPKHAINEKIVPKRATHKDKATVHHIHPIHQNESPAHPIIHSRTEDLKDKADPNNPHGDFKKKVKDSKSQPSLDLNQMIDLAYARIQEYLTIRKAKMEERQRKIQEAAANKRQEVRNSNHGRNKRETIDSTPAVEPKTSVDESDLDDTVTSARQVHQPRGHIHRGSTEAPSRTAPAHLHRSTEAPSRVTPTHRRRSTEAPSKIGPTHLHRSTETPSRTVPVQRKEKTARKQVQVPQKNTNALHYTTTKSPLANKHKARLHEHESRLNRHQLQKRDVLDDLLSKVKHVYDDVSTKVQKNMAPVEKWVEEQAEEVKHEFNELRNKRDLEALKEKFRESKEKLSQKIEEIRQHHRIHVRDAGSHHQAPRPAHHFDEKIKDFEKHLHHPADLKQRMKQDHERREYESAGVSKHKLEVPVNVLEPSRNRFKRDLEALKEKFRERKEKLRQKIEEIRQHHRIHVRDVGSYHQASRPAHHFDGKIKDFEKHLHHSADPKQRMKQDHERKEHKVAGVSKHKLEVPVNVVEPSRNRFVRSPLSNSLFDHEEENEITFVDDSDIMVPSNEFNKSSVDKSGLRNLSDILSSAEKKSTSSNENQCSDTNLLLGLWCETMMLFSSLFART